MKKAIPICVLWVVDIKPAQPPCDRELAASVERFKNVGKIVKINHATEQVHDQVFT